MSKLGLYFRLIVLPLLLISVFLAIRWMTPDKVQDAFDALGASTENLCPTRLSAIRLGDGRSIQEKVTGMKHEWIAQEPGAPAYSLSYLDIEKWLGRHCQFKVSQIGDSAGSAAQTGELLLRLEYIDGSVKELYRAGDVLSWSREQAGRFTSSELLAAIKELYKIAGFR